MSHLPWHFGGDLTAPHTPEGTIREEEENAVVVVRERGFGGRGCTTWRLGIATVSKRMPEDRIHRVLPGRTVAAFRLHELLPNVHRPGVALLACVMGI